MKREGILNPHILSLLARTGHSDYITVSDRGFPVPGNQECVDLSLVDDIPTVLDVLRAVTREFQVDRLIVTEEMKEFSPERYFSIRSEFPDLPVERVTHLEFKDLCVGAKGTIRTADTCSYANLILVSG